MTEAALNLTKDTYLDPSQIEHFWDLGFLVLRGVFHPQEIKKLSNSVNRIYEDSKKINSTQPIS